MFNIGNLKGGKMREKIKKIKVRIELPRQKGGPHGPKGGKKTYSRQVEKQKFRKEKF